MAGVVIGNLVLLGGFSALSYAFFLRRKEGYFQTLFGQLEKCQKFHLDYVDQVDQLPFDKNVLIFGTACSLTEEKIIAKSYIKKSDAEDRLWNYEFKDKFSMATAANQVVTIEPRDEDILAFNLPKNNENGGLEERIIHHNEPVCAYGRISREGEAGRKLVPEILMGSKQEKILVFLDQEILKYNRNSRISVMIGTGLLGLHFVYQMTWGPKAQQRQANLKLLAQMEPKK